MSLINQDILDKLRIKFFKDKNLLRTISGKSFSQGRAFLKVKIGKISNFIEFYVVKNENFKYQMLIGLDAIMKFKLLQDENLDVLQKQIESNTYVKIEKAPSVIETDAEGRMKLVNRKQFVQKFVNMNTIESKEEAHHLTNEMKKEIENLVDKYINCFASDKYDVGRIKSDQAHIKLTVDKYVAQRPYRCNIQDKKEIEEQIKHLLNADLIEESSSPFAAPVTLVHKREDGRRTRLCVDMRQLNKLVIPESQPFPRAEDIIEKTVDCEFFTVLDINSAFWSIPVRIEDREKLAFVTEENHYQWKVLPFGYRNAAPIFQRILSNIIKRRGLSKFCINFMDDIIIFSKTFKEHLIHIEKFLEAVQEEGFKLKLVKCKFAQKSVKYLGHVISKNQVKPLQDNLIAIKEFGAPKNKMQVRQFLGKVNYFHKYIENCAMKLEPLHNLLRKGVDFVWSTECENSFNDIKNELCSEPILQVFNPEKPIYINTDASGLGVAGIMKQMDENNELHPVAYFSKKLSPSQKKKPPIYIECLAIKESILFWQHQLIGREFVVLSDHKPLENLKLKVRPDTPLGELVIFLSQFNFKIIYREGKNNLDADALSRNPVLEYFENDEIIRTTNLIQLEDIINDQYQNHQNFGFDKDVFKKHKILFKIKKGRKRVLISEKLGLELIRKIHQQYGHIGTKTMIEMLNKHYYFRNLEKLVKSHCESCRVCIKNKSRTKKTLGFLGKLGPADKPFRIMSLDTVGGFAGNNSTKKYLHILTDHATKFAWIETSRTQSAKDFINLINQVAKKNEIGLILFDQYTGINSKELRKYLKEREIKFLYSISYIVQ